MTVGQDGGVLPDFDLALWGYERNQVERCLRDLTARLDDALGRLESVRVLQQQLCETRVELDQLRSAMARQPHWSHRLAELMRTAEQLREAAEHRTGASATWDTVGTTERPRGPRLELAPKPQP